jgi:hypothetical protein
MKLRVPQYGPRRITRVYQVSIPKDLLDRARLHAYDEVCLALSAENPQIICIYSPTAVTVTPLDGGTVDVVSPSH